LKFKLILFREEYYLLECATPMVIRPVGVEPRMMVLTRTSSNLLDLTLRYAVWLKLILYQTARYHRRDAM
jgi:hypothetical protein